MKPIALLFALCAALTLQAQGLKDAYKDRFRMGVALSGRNVRIDAEKDLIRQEFSSVTCENAMKPASVHPAPGVWRWEEADRIANFCRENKIPMRGHCLVWHNQFADWMFTDRDGNPVPKDTFYVRLREHIYTVVSRYKDIVYAWDVVNEAMSDGGPNPYRRTKLYDLCGDEFIAKAFQWAHEADPKAQLFYNDYNECNPRKRDNIFQMVVRMRAEGVPIDGIGMQGHYNIFYPSVDELSAAIELYASVVPHVHVTELDVRAGKEMGGQLQFKKEGLDLGDTVRAMHTEQYRKLFETFRRYGDKLECVTFWNLHDGCSWLGEQNYPLVFDSKLNKKPAYEAIRKW